MSKHIHLSISWHESTRTEIRLWSVSEKVFTNSEPYATRNTVSIFQQEDHRQICCIKYVNIIHRACQMISSVLMASDQLSFLPPLSEWPLVNRFPRGMPGLGRCLLCGFSLKNLAYHLLSICFKSTSTIHFQHALSTPYFPFLFYSYFSLHDF